MNGVVGCNQGFSSRRVTKCKDRKIEKFFSQMIEEIDLMNICVMAAQEYWVIGESFIYADLDENKGRWSRLMILNPDFINIQHSVVSSEPIISLRPDENLKRIVKGNSPADIQQRKQMNPSILEFVKKGQNIPLNNFYVSHIARKISPYETRGNGIIASCFRALMLFDKMRENKFAQAESMINPLTLVKIGNGEFRPTPADLEHWREIFESAAQNKDFKIFSHDAISIEKIGSGGAIYDIGNDVTQLIKEIYIGLMVPSVIMDGSDTTYATGSIALDVLRQRYMQFRNYMAAWLKNKIFAPISQINDFYEYSEGEKVLIVPEVDWNHMSLFDMDSYISQLNGLLQGDAASKKVSVQTFYRSLGLEYEEERRKIRYEDVQDAIRQREIATLGKLSLNDLKAIGPNDEIQEVMDTPVPGESPYEGEVQGGGDGGGGLGGAGLGGMPGAPPNAPIGMG